MSSKLDLLTKVLLNQIEAGEDKEEVMKEGLKSFAADMLNLSQMLRDRNMDPEASREIMEQQGMEYSGKTKKYS